MERLGLWGDGAPFKSFMEFLDTVQKKGLGVAEMLAMEMKSSGMYVSRGLSYRQAEVGMVTVRFCVLYLMNKSLRCGATFSWKSNSSFHSCPFCLK
jgi:hypothetical protein